MSEYETLGHMKKSSFSLQSLPLNYYLIPHHGIFQQSASGMKLRVVFDASAKSSSGFSLNDLLHTGARLQTDIVNVLTRFRFPKFVLTADISKMYRQILVHTDDQNLQLILWRPNPIDPISIYQLKTVTYGEACSPFLSLRTIQQLLDTDGFEFPRAAEIVRTNRYVDDILFGHDDVETLSQIRNEVIQLLARGQFDLKKWTSNEASLLNHIQHEDIANPFIFSDAKDQSIKTLGLAWFPNQDCFTFCCKVPPLEKWTKRALLSDTARIYDPLGLISPVVVRFKSLFQESWVCKSDWDDELPEQILKSWKSLRNELPCLNQLRIPRHVGSGQMEIHGFSDASQLAYAAVIYCRIVSSDNQVRVELIASKTKLAPLKSMTIPRLELCAAHLLAKLIFYYTSQLQLTCPVYLWSDSTTVLSWLSSLPRKFTTFVSNRIELIHELCPSINWHYVKSSENPADIASRGLSLSQILSCQFWWNGPKFLWNSNFCCPQPKVVETHEEEKPLQLNQTEICSPLFTTVFTRFSNFNRLSRAVAYVFRFISRCRSRINDQVHFLTAQDLKFSMKFIIKTLQQEQFPLEIDRLRSKQTLNRNSPLSRLNPLIDDEGILRVRGRIYSEELNSHCPILLPNGHVARLLVDKVHVETFHGGIRLMSARIQESYWIPGLNRLVKHKFRTCVRCQRQRASTYNPVMGQLPQYRILPGKPFSKTGLDFAGPLLLRPTQRRGRTTEKGYIAVFICCVTKALHLELVMSLSTNSLIFALRRFISRRGSCNCIYSDNGRNFVGVNRAFQEFRQHLSSTVKSVKLSEFLASSLIEWHFIPPYTPHFGGLWEAGVKSVKTHLARAFNGTTLTIEEIQTGLCQIESALNSRPLVPISFRDPLVPLTPSHLLTGEPSAMLPLSLIADSSTSARLRLEVISNTVRTFWKRWKSEYILHAMKKTKWLSPGNSAPALGDIVLVKRQADPPNFWPLGKIINLFPGSDQVVRVVEIETAHGRRREAVRNLVPLQLDAAASTAGNLSATE